MTRWLDPPPVNIDSLSALGLHPLAAQTLMRRGIRSPEEARAFLSADETPPAQFEQVGQAVERIRRAVQKNEKICVWGDFDVDGQTSTALLVQALQTIGADVSSYVPIRGRESHGVHVDSLAPILDGGVTLLLTCDTGITAYEAMDYADSRGVDVVLTDHHDLGESLPKARVILNPKMLPEGHRLKHLAGVGVAYKLAEALLNSEFKIQNSEFGNQNSEFLLDLVALGLIADVALLKGETRALAQKGIEQLRKTQRLGLKAIAELSGTNLETLTEETIGFTFAPRLNALGRLGDANPAVELLTTRDPVRARILATQIEGLNQQRRFLTSQVYEAAESQLKENPKWLEAPALILSHAGWPGGVVGIVANKLVEKYHKPAILFNEAEGILRGSARSVEGLHITEAIASQRDLLRGFGGHPMAAGMSLDAANLEDFRRGLGRAIEAQLGASAREEPALQIDGWLRLDELSLELAAGLEALAPFGAGNPPLILGARQIELKSAGVIGKTKEHLRLNVMDEEGNAQGILWWGGAGEDLPEAGRKFDIAYTLRASTFRGEKQLTLQFVEFRMTEEKPVVLPKPKIQIHDMRLQDASLQPATLAWAEGADKDKGVSRVALRAAEELVIYTAPPSPGELKKALAVVQPKTVHVYAALPAEESPETFLSRLAGICKFVLNQRGGETTLRELAAGMAAREESARLGLDWLGAGGHIGAEVEDDFVRLSPGGGEKNPYLQAELFTALRGVLQETAAYRKYLRTVADLSAVM